MLIYSSKQKRTFSPCDYDLYGSIIFLPRKSGDYYAEKGLLMLSNPLIFVVRYTIIKDQHQINEEIRDREVRVISAEGEQLGIMSATEALRIAEEADLDLVKISPNAVPPVCKIMNYGKFKFEQAKREKENRKNQKVIELKEIYLSMTIDVGDLNVKAKKTVEMLGDGNKVKVSIRMRGTGVKAKKCDYKNKINLIRCPYSGNFSLSQSPNHQRVYEVQSNTD